MSADMPHEIKGVTKVFGKTCNYTSKSSSGAINYKRAKIGDIVGYLQCDGWVDATCYKLDVTYICDETFRDPLYLRASCFWEV